MHITRRTRRGGAVLLAGLGVTALGLGAAAQLEIDSATLQAGDDIVAICQPIDQPILVEPVTTVRNGAYVVTGIRVSGVSTECGGHQFKARLLRANGTTIGSEYGGTLFLPPQPFTVPVPEVPAADWGGISAVIFN